MGRRALAEESVCADRNERREKREGGRADRGAAGEYLCASGGVFHLARISFAESGPVESGWLSFNCRT